MNILEKEWNLLKRTQKDLISQLLENRKIPKKERKNFLSPNFKSGLHDPMLLPDIKKAISRLKKAIEIKEKIGIFGDYDADGIPATALLAETLEEKFQSEVEVYIPARCEGYGLNRRGIDYLNEKGVSLLLTVDLGIREIDNIKYAKNLGIDTIVTDHHEPGEVLPEAVAVIDPKRKDSKYPFRELSGGGVVFKLIQALAQELGKITENDLKWMLDLVAITTICDVVPLVDENRIFAKFGLLVLSKTKRIGLQELYKAANIDKDRIDTYVVSFQIGPRLNAPGRMDHADKSYFLLREKNVERAQKISKGVNEINEKRQLVLEKMLDEARRKVLKNKLYNQKTIILENENGSDGLIGLVAGKLVEEFARPCFVFKKQEDCYKCSARSIDEFNLVEILENLKENIQKYGGHKKAAGLVVSTGNFKSFCENLLILADLKLKDKNLSPKIKVDADLKITDINLEVTKNIKKLEPFGMGNSKPVFIIQDVKAENIRTIGKKDKHLKFKISKFDAVWFGNGDTAEKLKNAENIDIAFNLEENVWHNLANVQLKIIDIKYKKG